MMKYNECMTCKAKDGRAGLLINDECLNCHYTRKNREVTIDATLSRTDKEIAILFEIVNTVEKL
jgi:hypothetical protein